jgi:hypothetical protein
VATFSNAAALKFLPSFLWVDLLMASERWWRKIGSTLGTA